MCAVSTGVADIMPARRCMGYTLQYTGAADGGAPTTEQGELHE